MLPRDFQEIYSLHSGHTIIHLLGKIQFNETIKFKINFPFVKHLFLNELLLIKTTSITFYFN